MALYLFLALICVPILEIAVFIQAGAVIGLWPTIGLVVLTAVAGTWLLRQQGLATLARAQRSMEHNRLPVNELFDGLCLLIAGILLLTPGFVTDSLGLLLLVPGIRTLLRAWVGHVLARSGHVHVAGRHFVMRDVGPGGDRDEPPETWTTTGDETVIEVDYTEIDTDTDNGEDGPGNRRGEPEPPR
jgi:UPF0716 protein FxsA